MVLGHPTPAWVWNELPTYFNRSIAERLHHPEVLDDPVAYKAIVDRATALYRAPHCPFILTLQLTSRSRFRDDSPPRYAPMRVTEPGHFSCAETLEAAGYPRIVLPVEPWEVVRWAYSYERENRTGDPFTRDAGHVLTYNKITSALLLHHTRRAEVPCGVHIGHTTNDARCYDADSFADDHTTFQGNRIVPCPPPSCAVGHMRHFD